MRRQAQSVGGRIEAGRDTLLNVRWGLLLITAAIGCDGTTDQHQLVQYPCASGDCAPDAGGGGTSAGTAAAAGTTAGTTGTTAGAAGTSSLGGRGGEAGLATDAGASVAGQAGADAASLRGIEAGQAEAGQEASGVDALVQVDAPPSAVGPAVDSGTAPDTAPVNPFICPMGAATGDPPLSDLLIDDLDDGNLMIPNTNGRSGSWSGVDDGSDPSVDTNILNGYCAARGHYSAHTSAKNVTNYAGFQVQLNDNNIYDLSAYDGITFWAAITGTPTDTATGNIFFPSRDSVPGFGICSDTPGNSCWDHSYTSVTLTHSWKKYVVRFKDLGQLGFGYQTPGYDPRGAISIEFRGPAGIPFNLWVDEVALLPKSKIPCPGAGSKGEAIKSDLLLDDLEDGDTAIAAVAGRSGNWFVFDDGTDMTIDKRIVDSSCPARGDYEAHVSATKLTGWGGGMAFNFGNAGADLSAYDGISFFGALTGLDAGANPQISVALPIKETEGGNGFCDDNVAGKGCSDHFATEVPLTGAWTKFVITFAQLAQAGWGYAVAGGYDASKATGVQFRLPTGTKFDLWIDDVALIPKKVCPKGGSSIDVPAAVLLADGETGDFLLNAGSGFHGPWFAYDDKTDPTVDDSIMSTNCAARGKGSMHAAATNLAVWGGGMGFDLILGPKPADLSAYRGFGFWAAATGIPDATLDVHVIFPLPQTNADNGFCDDNTMGQECGDNFGATMTLDGTWKYIEIPFTSMKQDGWGYLLPAYDFTHALGMHFQYPVKTSFDLWIDDIALVPK